MRHQSGDTVAGADMGGLPQYTSIQSRHPNTARAPQYSPRIHQDPIHPNVAPIQRPPIYKQPSPLQLQRPWTSKDCSSCKTQVYCYLCSTLQAYPSIITFCQFQSQTNNGPKAFSKSNKQGFT